VKVADRHLLTNTE